MKRILSLSVLMIFFTFFAIVEGSANVESKELENRLIQQEESLKTYEKLYGSMETSDKFLEEYYGGVFIDEKGNLNLNLTSLEEDVLNSFSKVVSLKDVKLKKVDASMKTLSLQRDALVEDIERLSKLGINVSEVYIDEMRNTVMVGVVNFYESKNNDISSQIKISNFQLYRDNEASVEVLYNCYFGMSINNVNSNGASVSFPAKLKIPTGYGTYTYQEGFVTTGHLADVGDTIYLGTTPLGQITKKSGSNGVDAAFVESSAIRPKRQIKNHNGDYVVGYSMLSYPMGTFVYKQGITTDWTSGTIVSSSVTKTISGVLYTDIVKASYDSEPGDSGGPVFIKSGSDYILIGTHIAGQSWPAAAYFGKYSNLVNELGAHVVL